MPFDSSGRPTEQGCRKAMWPVAMILAAVAGLIAGPILWAVLSAAILIVLFVVAIIASAGHGPMAGSLDFSSEWHDLFVGGIVHAALVGAIGGIMSVASLRSFVRWCKWRRELQPLLAADPALRARYLLPPFCKMVFAVDLLLCLVHLFLVLVTGFFGGILDEFPTLKVLVYAGLLAALLGVVSDIMLLGGKSVAAIVGSVAALATLGSIAFHFAGVISGPREPIHLTILMFLIPGLRIAWLAVFVVALVRFWRWARLPSPEVSIAATCRPNHE